MATKKLCVSEQSFIALLVLGVLWLCLAYCLYFLENYRVEEQWTLDQPHQFSPMLFFDVWLMIIGRLRARKSGVLLGILRINSLLLLLILVRILLESP